MPGSQSRNEKRLERYRELRALGFNAKDARKLRDQSGRHIESQISAERRRISRKPVQLRTSDESFKLRRLQDRSTAETQIRSQARMTSRRERWENFSRWSESRKFPVNYRRRISTINIRAGLPPDDGFGFRQFYYEYVERLSRDESSELAERNDSGVRWLINRSLVRNRINLRRLIHPPKSQSSAA